MCKTSFLSQALIVWGGRAASCSIYEYFRQNCCLNLHATWDIHSILLRVFLGETFCAPTRIPINYQCCDNISLPSFSTPLSDVARIGDAISIPILVRIQFSDRLNDILICGDNFHWTCHLISIWMHQTLASFAVNNSLYWDVEGFSAVREVNSMNCEWWMLQILSTRREKIIIMLNKSEEERESLSKEKMINKKLINGPRFVVCSVPLRRGNKTL